MTKAAGRLRRAWHLVREPIPEEKRHLLRERWEALDPRWRSVGQGWGRQATGCGATLGLHPRCDFACTGCYLGSNANHVRPIDLDAACRQLDRLRTWLGPKGNVQITDGEVTLLRTEHLVAILRHARGLGLIPMVMTHGDTFRRQPGLLERLMTDGGLTEVSLHVDTTQRGRLGYKNPQDERALTPLREEFAEMVRLARRRTRRPLRAAMSVTVTRQNLENVPDIVDWCFRNRDVLGMLSFQPVAQVGRTVADLRGVTMSELWERIDGVLARYGRVRTGPGTLAFGHPDCTRIELLAVVERSGSRPVAVPVVRDGDGADAAMLRAFFDRGLGGINFRDDAPAERVCRVAGLLVAHARWWIGPFRRWLLQRLREMGLTLPRLAWEGLRGRVSVGAFSVVSHHFMSPAELATEKGQERLSACVFRVPVGAEMLPMCQVNAGGVRAQVYASAGVHPEHGADVPSRRALARGPVRREVHSVGASDTSSPLGMAHERSASRTARSSSP